MVQTTHTTNPFIPTEYLGIVTFQAPMWGISSRQLESGGAVWVKLVIDLDVQVYVEVLAPAENVKKLMRRSDRAFKVELTMGGLLIKEIRTAGLAYCEDGDGYAVALATT